MNAVGTLTWNRTPRWYGAALHRRRETLIRCDRVLGVSQICEPDLLRDGAGARSELRELVVDLGLAPRPRRGLQRLDRCDPGLERHDPAESLGGFPIGDAAHVVAEDPTDGIEHRVGGFKVDTADK